MLEVVRVWDCRLREGGLGLLWDREQSSGCCCGHVQATGSAPLELAALPVGEEEEGGGR